MAELTQITTDYQETKRQMVGHNEMSREREERIDKYKADLIAIKEAFDVLEIEHGSLKINYEKTLG